MKYLFICGAPRSGTTAMWRLLSCDPSVILGVERYGNLFFKQPLTKDIFEPQRFLDNRDGDTFYTDLDKFSSYYKTVKDKFSSATFVGDKIPMLYMYLDSLFKNIPEAKVIFLIRNIFDVASSYEVRAQNLNDDSWKRDKRTEAAVIDWHRSLVVLKNYIEDDRVFPVVYEDFFFKDDGMINLYKYLNLTVSESVEKQSQALLLRSAALELGRTRDLPLSAVMHISLNAPFGIYRDIVKKVRERSY